MQAESELYKQVVNRCGNFVTKTALPVSQSDNSGARELVVLTRALHMSAASRRLHLGNAEAEVDLRATHEVVPHAEISLRCCWNAQFA
jgi:hypothetical protein